MDVCVLSDSFRRMRLINIQCILLRSCLIYGEEFLSPRLNPELQHHLFSNLMKLVE
jgi:hypothetical protein